MMMSRFRVHNLSVECRSREWKLKNSILLRLPFRLSMRNALFSYEPKNPRRKSQTVNEIFRTTAGTLFNYYCRLRLAECDDLETSSNPLPFYSLCKYAGYLFSANPGLRPAIKVVQNDLQFFGEEKSFFFSFFLNQIIS